VASGRFSGVGRDRETLAQKCRTAQGRRLVAPHRRIGYGFRSIRRERSVVMPIAGRGFVASTVRPRIVRVLALLFALGVAAPLAHAQSAFYDAKPEELPGKPGTLIRSEPLTGAPLGATAWRVLYRSVGLDGRPIAVSGVVVVPLGEPPPDGRPIVAWAHPTSGIVPRCAPSLALLLYQEIAGSRDMIRDGYIIAATDYPGLGTPGPHPYLVGVSEGRAVLDSIRAARELAGDGASRKAALWGHSQGGQAVLYGASLAKDYAPEIDLVGVAAAAPATELKVLIGNDLGTPGGKNLLAMTLWSWARVFNAPIDKVVVPEAMPAIDRLAAQCLESPIDILPRERIGKELQERFLSVDNLTSLEPWRTLMNDNTVGLLPPALPIFLAQGTADDTITPSVTANYKDRLCRNGSGVAYLSMPGVGHGLAGARAASTAIAWIDDRFAGEVAPSDCGS
jgi:acetyl esterase/lipase